tara:strand:+ start:138 stop:299 length:162 start_codon:yes stop_codon:yes gene_type:complete
VLLGMGRFNEAEAPLRRALRVAPRHDKARLLWWWLLLLLLLLLRPCALRTEVP